jgi:hypothetical protein
VQGYSSPSTVRQQFKKLNIGGRTIMTPSVLTDEQRERIRVNRERALAKKKQREVEKEAEQVKQLQKGHERANNMAFGDGDCADTDDKSKLLSSSSKRQKVETNNNNDKEDNKDKEEDVELEEWEVDIDDNIQTTITKKEAKEIYCLPDGTLAVCETVLKDNPHHKSWSQMKLYNRKEIRRRSHQRWGGMQGLVEERERRAEKRLDGAMRKSKHIFQSNR